MPILRRSPRVNRSKEKQEEVNALKGQGRENNLPKQMDKDQTGNEKRNQARENGSKNDGEGKMNERKLDWDSMEKNRIVEHVSTHHGRAQKALDTERST